MKPRQFSIAGALAVLTLAVVPTQATPFDPGDAQVLNIIWRVRNRQDLTETNQRYESQKMPNAGEIFYLPHFPYPGTKPLYRFVCPGGDHMTSPHEAEGQCKREYVLGNAYTDPNASPGLSMIVSPRGPSRNNRLLAGSDEGVAANSAQPLNLYGWRRFNNKTEDLVSVSGGGVTFEVNKVAGCSGWRWVWHGKQFINHRDLGREMQGSLIWVDTTHNRPNPTEAGDHYGNGSPCISATTEGSTLHTRTVPLEWNGGSLKGAQGGPQNPVIWHDLLIAKDVTLNYRNMGAVAAYKTTLTLARPLASGDVEIPTVYLGREFSDFYTYDAASNALNPVSRGAFKNATFVPGSGSGGVIAATPDHRYAMGVFGVTTSSGGSVTALQIASYAGAGGNGETSFATAKITAQYRGHLNAGANDFTSYVVCGTLSDVDRLMRTLAQSH